jgi:hypothetical protein
LTPLLAAAPRPCRHRVGDRWWVDQTYVKVAGQWRYVYRAIDQVGQVIDGYVSQRRDAGAARCFFTQALGCRLDQQGQRYRPDVWLLGASGCFSGAVDRASAPAQARKVQAVHVAAPPA